VDSFVQVLVIALPVTPALGALVTGLFPEGATRTIRALGWIFSILTLAVWICLRATLPEGEGLLVSVRFPWVPDLGVGLHFGLDELGLMMAGLVSFVGVVAVVGTLPFLPELNRSHIVFLLLAEAGMLGVTTSWDLILFIAFWEVTLVPFFFLMGRGPTQGGVSSATRFFVTSVTSSVLMWVGVLLVVKTAGLPRTFDLVELSTRFSEGAVPPVHMWLLVPAFLVRMAAMPLHTWFPVASANVETAAGVLLAGGVLPLGGYGLVHVVGRLCGPGLCELEPWFVWIGVTTALGGGVASIVQRDLKRLLAYACLSQVGLALIGLTVQAQGVRMGGALMLVAAGLGGASLFLFAGVVCKARGSQRIGEISGLWRSNPMFAGLAFAGVASVAAMPGTCGFVGAVITLRGVSDDLTITALVAGAVLVTGASVVWAYRRVLGGSHQPAVWAGYDWPRKRQIGILLVVTVVILLTGFLPGLISPGAGSRRVSQASLDSPRVASSQPAAGIRGAP
jgi:NADH-quinone oxidoreductase subunit M